MKRILNTEIQANRGPIFTFSLSGGRRAPLPPVSYATGKELYLCTSILNESDLLKRFIYIQC